eukprot:Phypoly_transcript_00424.p1 GENE.Phypoly_transcript_00424~~Phypoly_transcript_00424.p1  ORF type:complete len:1603 (+),score=299.16 Phypoly_transcript_00424:284-4810(+)
MEQYYLDHSNSVWGGIEFTQHEPNAEGQLEVDYAIRIDFFNQPDTKKRINSDPSTDEPLQASKDYLQYGFVGLQLSIDSAILALATQETGYNITTFLSPSISQFDFNKAPLWRRYLDLASVYEILGAIFIIIALFTSNFRYLANIVAEKESKIREEMRMMGLLPAVDNWAWFTTVMIVTTVPTLIAGGILIGSFYHFSSGATILFILFSELFSLYSLAILVSLFVNKSKFAGVLGFVVAIAFTIAAVVAESVGTGESAKLVLALLSPAALVFANRGIMASEKAYVGTRTSNLSQKWKDDTPSVGAMIAFMYLDTILYAFLAWYIDNVFPGEFGIARPPWFFVTKKYWSDTFGLKDSPTMGLLANAESSDDVEAVSPELQDQAAVVIKKLRKTFKKGFGKKFAAVDGLNLNMYDGQITAFLGHNGAGKTTTISMLTGLIPVTSGDAYVRGYSIRSQMRQVRTSLGICPQHDVIWPELTVYDHLFLYAGLKGVPYKSIKRTVDELIEEIGLTEKRLFQAGALSGGQKRKLCLAMAFVGGSDVIFLDEPTSGMDPVTRRGVWDFLNANKKGRTIVLTTHFMDEADFLGDRVAIISHGQLRCAGSSLFLKSRLGVGYLLVMTKNKSCEPEKVNDIVLRNIPGATVLSAFGGELQYRLPKEAAHQFADFFTLLDANKEAIGIDSYGVSLTTLEEVFLRIGMEEKIDRDEDDEDSKDPKELTEIGKDQAKINVALAHETEGHRFGQQLRAQLVKRAVMYRRDVRGMFFTFFLPFAFLILSSAVIRDTNTVNINTTPPPPLAISTTLYGFPYFYTGNLDWLAPNPLSSSTTFTEHDASTFDDFIKNSFSGVASGAYHLEQLGSNFSTLPGPPTSYGIEFNDTLYHIVPAEIAFVDDALIRRFSGNRTFITVTAKPFPHVLDNVEKAISEINPDLLYWSLIMLAVFCLIPAGFVASIVQERVLNVKRLLSVSGASRSSYWASNFLWDWGMFLVLVIIGIIVVGTAGHKNFTSDEVGAVFVLFLLFSLFITAQSYVLSLFFKSYSIVTGALFAIHFIMALAFNIAYNIITFNAIDNPAKWSDTVDRCFFAFNVVSPQFGFLSTLQRLAGFVSLYQKTNSWYTIHLAGFPLIMFAVHFLLWTTILLLIEYRDQIAGRFKREPKQRHTRNVIPAEEDSDVTAERNRLLNDPNAQNDLVRVIGLRKEYPAPKGGIKVAVKNLTLGIPRSECFGLLGMNGAGKSTTLGAMSGDIVPTQGDIWLNGYNLATSPNDALRFFGWCPQFDALIGLLTGREQLTMYARIKGLNEKIIPDTVTAFLQMLDLTQYANRPVKGYSGGNKRKLSLAVAMIGNPPIVFLDEPSTGMDPLARRYMWNVITALGANKSVIVTTHSMEECDALATRIGIMSQGELVCLGTSQHLKTRFASGYSLQLKAKPQYLDQLKAYVSKVFPLAQVADEHGDLLAYELPQSAGYKLAFIFAELQSQSTFLEDFSVSQTTLEQVFLKLAKEKAEGVKVDVAV